MTSIDVSLKDAMEGRMTIEYVGEGDGEHMSALIYKGGSADDETKDLYQAFVDGVGGDQKRSMTAAVNSVLAKLDKAPANYSFPDKWSEVKNSNKPPEVESLDDLDKDVAAGFKKSYAIIEKSLANEDKTKAKLREVAFTLAGEIVNVRSDMSKEDWKYFRQFAPDGLKGFLGKNAVGEYFKAGKVLALDGVAELIPSGVSGAKGVVTAYQGAINVIAGNAVALLDTDWNVDPETGKTVQIRAILNRMLQEETVKPDILLEAGVMKGIPSKVADEDGNLTKDAPADQMERADNETELALIMLEVHLDNWGDEEHVFGATDAGWVVRKYADGDNKGTAVVGTLFGLEGDDELGAAIGRALAMRDRAIAAEKEAAEGSAAEDEVDRTVGAMANAVRSEPFATWDQERAARHLLNIMACRLDEETDEKLTASISDVNGILNAIGEMVDKIADGTMSMNDILNGEPEPGSDEDEEAEADAIDG